MTLVNGAGGPGGMGTFGRRLLLGVDAKGYGGADVLMQTQFQQAIPRLLHEAADAAGLDREHWVTQEAGDSVLAVLPEGASEPALVDVFMRRLDAGLRAFNHGRIPEAWLRLRAAVHFGTASPGANGFVGRAPVEIGRIRDSAVLRSALASAPDVCLAVAVSATVFNDVVREAYTTIRAEEFLEVRIAEKEYTGRAWLWVPGHDIRALDPAPASEPASAPAPGPASEPASAPAPGPASASAHEPASGPASASAHEPASARASEPASAPTPGPASTPAHEPASAPASEPARASAAGAASEPAPAPTPEPAPAPAPDPAPEPAPAGPDRAGPTPVGDTVVHQFYGTVHAERAVFGISK